MTRLSVIVDQGLADELRARIPRRGRSRFIAAALQEKLIRLRQEEAIEATAGAWSERTGDPESEIRVGRVGWASREGLPEGSDG